jgi:protein SCO1/2
MNRPLAPRIVTALILLLPLAALAALFALALTARSRPAAGGGGGGGGGELPVLGQVPPFTLTDQDGGRFDSSVLAGKIWVADFIFTSCGAACPMMTGRLGSLQDAVEKDPALREKVLLVSFSVDPERDTPAALAAFAERFGARRGRWLFLTGEKGVSTRLSREAFLLAAEDGSAESIPTHSDRFALVDAQGRLRGHYQPGEEGEIERLLAHLRRLVAGEE